MNVNMHACIYACKHVYVYSFSLQNGFKSRMEHESVNFTEATIFAKPWPQSLISIFAPKKFWTGQTM